MKNLFNKPHSKSTFAVIPGLTLLLLILHVTMIPNIIFTTLAMVIGIFINYSKTPQGKKVFNPGLHKYDLVYFGLALVMILLAYTFKDLFNVETWNTLKNQI